MVRNLRGKAQEARQGGRTTELLLQETRKLRTFLRPLDSAPLPIRQSANKARENLFLLSQLFFLFAVQQEEILEFPKQLAGLWRSSNSFHPFAEVSDQSYNEMSSILADQSRPLI